PSTTTATAGDRRARVETKETQLPLTSFRSSSSLLLPGVSRRDEPRLAEHVEHGRRERRRARQGEQPDRVRQQRPPLVREPAAARVVARIVVDEIEQEQQVGRPEGARGDGPQLG